MTLEQLSAAERDAVQMAWLRRYLALACPQGTRRTTDPKPIPPAAETLAGRRDRVRRLRQSHLTTPQIAAQVDASIATVTRDLAWLRAEGRL